MNNHHTSQSKTGIITDKISLLAEDPQALSEFYQQSIGLTLVQEESGSYLLGNSQGQVLLEIHQAQARNTQRTTGLYHLALLLPTRQDLGNIFNHLLENQVALDGASDHGYSEAIYLKDPEGNGIEIYVDKDRSQWDINPQGQISGVVEAMDAQGVLVCRDGHPFQGLADDTRMGHVHLHVDNLETALDFYYHVMGLGLKSKMGAGALFMASGDYHHHLGMNTWKGKDLPAARPGDAGLGTVYWLGSRQDIDFIEEKLKERAYPYHKQDQAIHFKDPAGIHIQVDLQP